jgi:hypothetical protein
MAAPSGPLLALAALLAGAVVGGLAGAALAGRSPTPPAVSPSRGSDARSTEELAAAIEELAREVRALARMREARETDRREVDQGDPALEASSPDVIAALDRLTATLVSARGAGAGAGGIGQTRLHPPPGGKNLSALRGLLGVPMEENSRRYRFYSFQQVLDTFGAPDQADNGNWYYRLEEEDKVVSFDFEDGYLMNIYD